MIVKLLSYQPLHNNILCQALLSVTILCICTAELDDHIEELSQHVQPQQTWQERQDSSNE